MKKNWMKKGIVSLIMLAIFLAPVSGQIGKDNNKESLTISLNINNVEAVNLTDYFDKDSYIKINSKTSNSVNFSAGVIINDKYKTNTNTDGSGKLKNYDAYDNIKGALNEIQQKGVFICYKETSDPKDPTCYSWYQLGIPFRVDVTNNEIVSLKTGTDKFNLKPKTGYTLYLIVVEGVGTRQSIWNWVDFSNNDIKKSVDFTTTDVQPGDEKNTFTDTSNNYSNTGTDITPSFGCGITNISGCVAQVFYSLAMAASWVPLIAGYFLDFFVYYATNSSSYSNEFVQQAWGAIRDIANIFFIIALLYVAMKTILGLNVTNNKKLVGTVIIIALIINFSLFTSKLVIDGTNILAKVFYNNINSKDSQNNSAIGAKGQKSISIGLVDKFNPQKLIMATYQQGLGYFIFLTILLIIVSLYTAYVFFSIALLFVARVVSLWISMIFSPIAFASYTVPFDIPGFGHREWWKNLLENAFLAPVFIFMLYIIVLFAGFLNKISYPDTSNLDTLSAIMQNLMSVLVPFVILMILLKKSKELTVKYAGELGASIQNAGKMLGGAAVGIATGGTAMLGRQTIGRGMAAAANSGWAKKWEAAGWGGGMARNLLKAGGKGSFDIRGVKIAGKDLGATGLKVNTLVGGPQKGGFEQIRKEKVAKKQQRAKDLEVGEDEKLKQDLNNLEVDLQTLLRKNSHDLETLDKQIKAKRENSQDAQARSRTLSTISKDAEDKAKEAEEAARENPDDQNLASLATAARAAANTAKTNADGAKQESLTLANELSELKKKKKAIKDATVFTDSAGVQHDFTLNKVNGRSISELEDKAIPDAHHHIETETKNRQWTFAAQTAAWGGKANREAAYRIRTNAKIESTGGKKGSHSEPTHAPAPAAHHEPAHEEPAHAEPAHNEPTHDSDNNHEHH